MTARRAALLKLGFVGAVIIGGVVAVRLTPLSRLTNYEDFLALVESFGYWAPLIYVTIYAIGPIFLAPGTLLTVVGGAVFGTGLGFVLITIGANLGAILAFLVGRWASGDWVESKLEGSHGRLARFQAALEENGFVAVLVARLLMAPYNAFNYIAALTRIRFRDYVAGTFLGIMPVTFGMVFLSDTVAKVLATGDWGQLLAPKTFVAVAILAACMGIPVVVLKRARGRSKGEESP